MYLNNNLCTLVSKAKRYFTYVNVHFNTLNILGTKLGRMTQDIIDLIPGTYTIM